MSPRQHLKKLAEFPRGPACRIKTARGVGASTVPFSFLQYSSPLRVLHRAATHQDATANKKKRTLTCPRERYHLLS